MEYAHLITWDEYRQKVKPHGIEWKNNFSRLMRPFISNGSFPEDVVHALEKHMTQVTASSCVDINLQKTMRLYDSGPIKLTLEEIPEDALFVYAEKRVFKKGPRLRKRYKCQSIKDGRMYLFSPLAEIKLMED